MQPLQEPTAEQSIDVNAPVDRVWAIIGDPTRTPEWSPVCHRVDWIGDGRFRGYNRLNGVRWSRECVVTESEPGRTFAFSTLFKGEESTRWRYRLEPFGDNTGTRLTEAYGVVRVPTWVRLFRMIPGAAAKSDRDTRWNIATSLQRIKTLAESTEGSSTRR